MESFKKYFHLTEKTYFINLAEIANNAVNELISQIRQKDNFKSGDSFTVPFFEGKDITFIFYKEYSKFAKDELKKMEDKSGSTKIYAIYDSGNKRSKLS